MSRERGLTACFFLLLLTLVIILWLSENRLPTGGILLCGNLDGVRLLTISRPALASLTEGREPTRSLLYGSCFKMRLVSLAAVFLLSLSTTRDADVFILTGLASQR